MTVKELYAKLGLKVETSGFRKGERLIAGLKTGLKTFAAVTGVAAAGMAAIIKRTADAGDKFAKTAQKIGIGVEALQEIAHAADHSGVSFDAMSNAVGFLARSMAEAGDKRSIEEVLMATADQFAEMPDGAQKTALAMKLFGRAGKDLIPLLNSGSGGIASMRKEARDLGIVMSEKATKDAEAFNDSLTRVKAALTGLGNTIAGQFLGDLTQLSEEFAQFLEVLGRKQGFRDFVSGVGNVLAFTAKMVAYLIQALHAVGEALGILAGIFVETFGQFISWIDRTWKRLGSFWDEIVENWRVTIVYFFDWLTTEISKIPDKVIGGAKRAALGLVKNLPGGEAIAARFGSGGSPESSTRSWRGWNQAPPVNVAAPQMTNNLTIMVPPGSDGKTVAKEIEDALRRVYGETMASAGAQ